ncbi:MAG: RdgB/HAM1 family non-canonical purine NTP pyrophosphatase [Dehalococcoidia bacterium]
MTARGVEQFMALGWSHKHKSMRLDVLKRLLIATNNQGKLVEFRSLLADCGWLLVAPVELGLALDVEESADSYELNARLKAQAFADASGLAALADDSGLEVDALNGGPGVRSARYGGPGLDERQRVVLLLDALKDVPDERRPARFRCVLILSLPDGRIWQTEGRCDGTIARESRGADGFGYDPVFLLPGSGRTMAELSPHEKDAISHRARACAAMLPHLKRLGEDAAYAGA